jgi:hypothetical protein
VTPLTKEHTKEVADLFSPTKAAERASADTNATLTEASGDAGELRPVDSMYALGDCCANTGKQLSTILAAKVRTKVLGAQKTCSSQNVVVLM